MKYQVISAFNEVVPMVKLVQEVSIENNMDIAVLIGILILLYVVYFL